jgi:hypothetical protein
VRVYWDIHGVLHIRGSYEDFKDLSRDLTRATESGYFEATVVNEGILRTVKIKLESSET